MIVPLPWERPPLTGNRTRGNPYARANEVKVTSAEAFVAVNAAKLPPIVACDVTLHFRPADRRRRDADGMFPTLKVVQDSLVAAGVLHEDSWVTIPAATCRIHPPQRGIPAAMWMELSNITRKVRTA